MQQQANNGSSSNGTVGMIAEAMDTKEMAEVSEDEDVPEGDEEGMKVVQRKNKIKAQRRDAAKWSATGPGTAGTGVNKAITKEKK